jgi:hypothetical protein
MTSVQDKVAASNGKVEVEQIFELPRDLRFVLEGVTPLLMSNPALSMDPQASNRMTTTRKNIPTPEEEARRQVYRLDDGRLYVPATQVRGAIVGAAARFKEKGRLSSLQNAVNAALSFEETEFVLRDGDGGFVTAYAIDTRYAKVQGKGVMRSRPIIALPWLLECHFELDEALIPARDLQPIIQAAGKRCGIGDFRPATKGWFGKFKLITMSVQDLARRALGGDGGL